MSTCAKDIFKLLLNKSKKNTEFTTMLHYYSPKVYEYVRNTFMKNLPHSVTIRKWFQKIHSSPGINKASIQAVQTKVDLETKINNRDVILCNIVMDEMKTK